MASIFSLIFILSLAVSAFPSEPSKSLIAACMKTPEPKTCVDFLSDQHDSSNANYHVLTKMSVRSLAMWAKTVSDDVFFAQNEDWTGHEFANCLSTCSDAMDDILDKFEHLKKATVKKNYPQTSAIVKLMMKDISACHKSCLWKDGTMQISTLTESTSRLNKLCKVTLAFAKLDAS